MACGLAAGNGWLRPDRSMESPETHDKAALGRARREIDGALSRDRARLQALWARWTAKPADSAARAAFTQALANSVAQREARAAALPSAPVEPSLPIAAEADHIIELIRRHPVVVIAGETGSGKTTQIPKLCLAAGRGAAGMIGCTQPRRIAARAIFEDVYVAIAPADKKWPWRKGRDLRLSELEASSRPSSQA